MSLNQDTFNFPQTDRKVPQVLSGCLKQLRYFRMLSNTDPVRVPKVEDIAASLKKKMLICDKTTATHRGSGRIGFKASRVSLHREVSLSIPVSTSGDTAVD